MKPKRLWIALWAVVIGLTTCLCNLPGENTPPQVQPVTPNAAGKTPESQNGPQNLIVPTPPLPLTFVTLGDSLTLGDGDELEKHGYVGRVQAKIAASFPGTTATNLGQSGWSSDALIEGDQGQPGQLAAAEKIGATFYCVWIGSNDLWYLYEYQNAGPDQEKADLARYEKNINTILKTLSARATVLIATLDDQSKRPVATEGKAFPSITPQKLKQMSAQTAAYNEIIRKAARQYPKVVVVDLSSTQVFTTPALLADDGNHPNAAGYEQLAEVWYGAIAPVIRLPEPPPGTR